MQSDTNRDHHAHLAQLYQMLNAGLTEIVRVSEKAREQTTAELLHHQQRQMQEETVRRQSGFFEQQQQQERLQHSPFDLLSSKAMMPLMGSLLSALEKCQVVAYSLSRLLPPLHETHVSSPSRGNNAASRAAPTKRTVIIGSEQEQQQQHLQEDDDDDEDSPPPPSKSPSPSPSAASPPSSPSPVLSLRSKSRQVAQSLAEPSSDVDDDDYDDDENDNHLEQQQQPQRSVSGSRFLSYYVSAAAIRSPLSEALAQDVDEVGLSLGLSRRQLLNLSSSGPAPVLEQRIQPRTAAAAVSLVLDQKNFGGGDRNNNLNDNGAVASSNVPSTSMMSAADAADEIDRVTAVAAAATLSSTAIGATPTTPLPSLKKAAAVAAAAPVLASSMRADVSAAKHETHAPREPFLSVAAQMQKPQEEKEQEKKKHDVQFAFTRLDGKNSSATAEEDHKHVEKKISAAAPTSTATASEDPNRMHSQMGSWSSRIQQTADAIRKLQQQLQETP